MTVVSDYTAILSGTSLHDSAGKAAFYTFSFLAAVPDYYANRFSAQALATFRPLTEAERAIARQALDAWASASGLTFFEVPGGEGDIVFGAYDMSQMGFGGFTGYAFYPSGRFDDGIKSDIFFSRTASFNLQLALHEIGHALGFKHPHEDEPTLSPQFDNYSYTVMSYKSGGFSGQSLGTFDLEAIHYLYGGAGADGTQVTSWSWDPASYTLSQTGGAAVDSLFGVGTADVILGLGGNDFIQGRGGSDQLNGGDGDDEILGGRGNDVLTGELGADRLNGGDGDDRLVGGDGADDLLGGIGDDRFEGGGGGDLLQGDSGADRFVYISIGDSNPAGQDRLVAFETGVDKIDLAALGPTNVSWTESSTPKGPNSLVTVTTAGGTMTLLVEAHLSLSDFILTAPPPGPIVGSAANDVLQGTSGPDSIRGEGGNDTLFGLGDNDILDGGSGVDRMVGGSGDDTFFVDDAGDVIEEGVDSGADHAISSVSYVLAANVENLTLAGTAALAATGNALNNILVGNSGANLLDGGPGADWMVGRLGDDVYVVDDADLVDEAGDGGTDEVRTALAAYALPANVETLRGTSASGQSLTGNALANVLAGGAGNDLLDGGAGADQLAGGLGNDVYLVDSGDTVIEAAGAGTDEVRTALAAYALGADIETLVGTSSSGQSLTGNGLGNLIAGAAGNDVLDGGAGADQLLGGAGNDLYLVDSGDSVVEAANAGSDEVRTALAAYALTGHVENLTGTSALGQTLTGNDLVNILVGGAGDDRLDGGGAADFLDGGLGNDLYVVDSGDSVTEAANAGSDEVRTALAVYALGANFEALTGSSAAGQTLVGNELDNRIVGNAGADLLYGLGGIDRLEGGGGDDRYVVDNAADLVIEAAGQGYDTLFSTVTYGLAAGTAVEALSTMDRQGLESIDFTGNELGNALYGNAGANRLSGGGGADFLDGGAGADTMLGGADNDIYYVDDAGDVVVETAGEGTDEIRTSLDSYSLLGSQVERLTATTNSAHDFRGSAGANVLTGSVGNDLLRLGDGGNDSAFGGAGSDVLYFGATFTGADVADGGDGRDVLILQGDYLQALSATNLVGIESISLQSGARTTWGDLADNFYDYFIATHDSNVAAGQQLIVNGQTLRPGEDFTFDGSDETDGFFLVYGGHGDDTLKGGAGNDTFFFEGARWGAGDTVDGGAGRDALIISAGNGITHIEFGAASLTSIESISLNARYATDPTARPSYELVLDNGNVTSGGNLIVNGNSLADRAQSVSVDGSAVQDGSLTLIGGFGNDTLIGGDGGDLLQGGEGMDVLTGGGGADVFRYAGAYDATSQLPDRITDFTSGVDRIDLGRIDADAFAAGDQAFHWIGSGAFGATGAASAGELRAYEYQGSWYVEGDMDGNGAADLVLQLTAPVDPVVQSDFLL